MSTHNICFYRELTKIILQLSVPLSHGNIETDQIKTSVSL